MSTKNKPNNDDSTLAMRRAQLDDILSELEAGNIPIEEVAGQLQVAADLAKSIEADLRNHKASIQVLKEQFNKEG